MKLKRSWKLYVYKVFFLRVFPTLTKLNKILCAYYGDFLIVLVRHAIVTPAASNKQVRCVNYQPWGKLLLRSHNEIYNCFNELQDNNTEMPQGICTLNIHAKKLGTVLFEKKEQKNIHGKEHVFLCRLFLGKHDTTLLSKCLLVYVGYTVFG